jgi:hypothetical protein
MAASNSYSSIPSFKWFVVSAFLFAFAVAFLELGNMRSSLGRSRNVTNDDDCQEVIQTEAKLSRQQLAEVLIIPERDSKERVRQILAEPYCRLADINVRAGVNAEREAYPLEFDKKTQLVILYEDDEYAGYRFKFK